MFPFTRTVLVFFIAGLLFCALSTSNIGSVSHPVETGLLIPSDKGEVGGSSPPRPTIQIASKYASILTFPLFGALPQETVLSTVCQLSDWPGWHYTQGVKTLRVKPERLASIRLRRERCPATSKDVEGSARHCKTVQGVGSHFSQFAGA